ncbi:MAG: zinc-ribbon and DUF3426 domain-containing protein [Leucothrix sp.]
MYTRCSHCSAVFRVTMKELTAAQGKLRCGECSNVFNAMDNLSTKLPNQADPSQNISFDSLNRKQQPGSTTNHAVEQNAVRQHSQQYTTQHKKTGNLWLILSVFALCVALITQVWFSRELWFSKLRQPNTVKMLSKKVFSHPNQPDALVITASIKSFAKESQPFPYLEARLLDVNNQTIALRRFRPHEYLGNYQPDALLMSNAEVSIRLKIKDPPGNRAKHFQFSFL